MNAHPHEPPRGTEPPGNPPVLIRFAEVSALTCLSRSTIYKLMRAGTFPQPIRPSPRATAWFRDEITAWVIAQREGRKSTH